MIREMNSLLDRKKPNKFYLSDDFIACCIIITIHASLATVRLPSLFSTESNTIQTRTLHS